MAFIQIMILKIHKINEIKAINSRIIFNFLWVFRLKKHKKQRDIDIKSNNDNIIIPIFVAVLFTSAMLALYISTEEKTSCVNAPAITKCGVIHATSK